MNLKQDNRTELSKKSKYTVEPKRLPVKFLLTIAVIAVLILIGVIAGLIPRFRQHAELLVLTREHSVPTVNVISPKPGQSSSDLPLAAEVKPQVDAPIYARANGYIKRRLVDIGANVEAGQLLAEIDAPEIKQELERNRAQLAQAEAALGLAKLTAERWAGLLKTASVSEQENAEKQADFKLKTASVESASAEVRRLEELKSFTRIRAPFAGTITARNIDVGDLIVAGVGKELFHLAQTRKLRVFVQVPETMARGIRSSQTAEVTIPELPGRTFIAKIIRNAGVIASDSRTLLVELELNNPKGEILAGGYAQVRFNKAKISEALTLPANTVIFRSEGPQVGIVKSDGIVELRAVKLGRDFGQTIEILTGVSPKDSVILNPPDTLATGATVLIAQAVKMEKIR